MKKPYFSYIFCFLSFASLLSSCQSSQVDQSGNTDPQAANNLSEAQLEILSALYGPEKTKLILQ